MRLNAPTQTVFLLSAVLALLSLLSAFVPAMNLFYGQGFWLAAVAWAILAAGSLMKGV